MSDWLTFFAGILKKCNFIKSYSLKRPRERLEPPCFDGFETEVSDGPLFSSEDDCRFRESSGLVFVQ